MNTEQRARFEAWAKEQGRTTGTLDGIRYFDPFVRGLWTAFQAAETPLLARIAELEGQLANREPFVVKIPDYHYVLGCPCVWVDEIKAAITAAGGVCVNA